MNRKFSGIAAAFVIAAVGMFLMCYLYDDTTTLAGVALLAWSAMPLYFVVER